MDVKQTLWKVADWIDLGQGRWVVGCCERGNETSCFILYEDYWTKEVKNTLGSSATSVAARPNNAAPRLNLQHNRCEKPKCRISSQSGLTHKALRDSYTSSGCRRACRIAKSDYWLRHACLSVRVEQLRSHWTAYKKSEICGFFFFRKPVKKIQISLKSDKYSGHFTRRRTYVYDNTSLFSSYNEKCFRQKLYRIPKHSFCVQKLSFENRTIFSKMWKNKVDPDRPQVTIQYGVRALHAG